MAGKKVKRLAKDLKNTKKNIIRDVTKYLDEATPRWHTYARSITPIKTGAIRENVILNSLHGFDTIRYRIVAFQPVTPRNRPYMMWHHGFKQIKGPKGKGYDLRTGRFAPKSGTPDFMFKLHERVNIELTADKMGKIAHKDIKQRLIKPY